MFSMWDVHCLLGFAGFLDTNITYSFIIHREATLTVMCSSPPECWADISQYVPVVVYQHCSGLDVDVGQGAVHSALSTSLPLWLGYFCLGIENKGHQKSASKSRGEMPSCLFCTSKI